MRITSKNTASTVVDDMRERVKVATYLTYLIPVRLSLINVNANTCIFIKIELLW